MVAGVRAAVPAKVTEFTATGRYEDFTTAVSALDGALNLAAPGTARILFLVGSNLTNRIVLGPAGVQEAGAESVR